MCIGADSPIQQDLFDINAEQIQKMKRLDAVIDRINRMQGNEWWTEQESIQANGTEYTSRQRPQWCQGETEATGTTTAREFG